jgi:hypothetical protein
MGREGAFTYKDHLYPPSSGVSHPAPYWAPTPKLHPAGCSANAPAVAITNPKSPIRTSFFIITPQKDFNILKVYPFRNKISKFRRFFQNFVFLGKTRGTSFKIQIFEGQKPADGHLLLKFTQKF